MSQSFHAIYWPAFLLALDLPLPQRILAHAHWTLGKEKMSKSLGNVVNPFFAIKRFGVDGMRYFLARNGGIKDDAMYDNSFIIERYKIDLQFGLGNLLSRVVRGKGWSVRQAVQLHQLPTETTAPMLIDALKHLPTIVSNILETNLDIGMALQTIMEAARQVRFPPPLPSPPNPNPPPPKLNPPFPTRQTNTCKFPPPGTSSPPPRPPTPPNSAASSTSAPSRSASAASCCSPTCPPKRP